MIDRPQAAAEKQPENQAERKPEAKRGDRPCRCQECTGTKIRRLIPPLASAIALLADAEFRERDHVASTAVSLLGELAHHNEAAIDAHRNEAAIDAHRRRRELAMGKLIAEKIQEAMGEPSPPAEPTAAAAEAPVPGPPDPPRPEKDIEVA